MKLSEAIRLGAMWSPQGHDGWMDTPGRCALASAAEAVSITPVDMCDPMSGAWRPSLDYGELRGRFPVTRAQAMTPCDCGDKWWQFAKSLEHIVWHLNDKHKWTREQIAEWVETIEAQQEAKVAEQPEPVHVRP